MKCPKTEIALQSVMILGGSKALAFFPHLLRADDLLRADLAEDATLRAAPAEGRVSPCVVVRLRHVPELDWRWLRIKLGLELGNQDRCPNGCASEILFPHPLAELVFLGEARRACEGRRRQTCPFWITQGVQRIQFNV